MRQTLAYTKRRKMFARADELQSEALKGHGAQLGSYNALVHSPAGFIQIGSDRDIVCVNLAALRHLGLEPIHDSPGTVSDIFQSAKIFSPQDQPVDIDAGPLSAALREGTVTDDFNCRIHRPDGTEGWLRFCFSPIRSPYGDITGATIVILDVHDKIIAKRITQQVTRRLLNKQEEERSRFAYQLNDAIGQELAALKIMLHTSLKESDRIERIEKCISQVDALMDSARNLSMELRPAELDDLGLLSAIRWYLTRRTLPGKVDIVLDANVSIPKLSPEVAIACYRIVQEAVSNAIEHARATTLVVKMYVTSGEICIDIDDDGTGFEITNTETLANGTPRFGLIAMRERANLARGQLSVRSAIGNGTKITARFPRE